MVVYSHTASGVLPGGGVCTALNGISVKTKLNMLASLRFYVGYSNYAQS